MRLQTLMERLARWMKRLGRSGPGPGAEIGNRRESHEHGSSKHGSVDDAEVHRALLNLSRDAAFVVSPDGVVRFVSPSVVDLTGHEPSEWIGRDCMLVLCAEERDRVRDIVAACVADGKHRVFTARAPSKDGGIRTIEFDMNLWSRPGRPPAILGIARDVSERETADTRLRESAERFRRMAESLHDGLAIVQDQKTIYVNERMCEIFGRSCQEMLSSTGMQYVAPEERERLMAIRDRTVHTGTPLPDLEYWIIRGDGKRRCIHNRYSVTFGEDGHISRYIITSDATERVLMERDLLGERDRAQQVLDVAGVILVVIGIDENVEMINAKGLEILQCREDDVVGMNWFDGFVPEWDRRRVRHVVTQLLTEGTAPDEAPPGSASNENSVVTASGEERIISWTNAVLRDADGTPTAVLSSGIDVTEARRAERLLNALNRASTAMQDAITLDNVYAAAARELEALGVRCSISRIDEEGRRARFSHIALPGETVRLLHELVGLECDDFFMNVDAVPALRRAVHNRETVYVPDGVEMIAQLLPPSTQWLAQRIARILDISRTVIAPLVVGDHVVAIMMMHADYVGQSDIPSVTAFANRVAAAWRKAELLEDLAQRGDQLARTQAELIQANKMDALGRLAGGIAHDFNNILTVMTGYCQMAMMSLTPECTAHADLGQILEAGRQAANLTRQLLAFSRQQPLNVCNVNLNETLKPMARLLRPLIGEAIALDLDLAPETLMVEADPAQLNQVVMNLAINARDAMPRGGHLRIETRAIDCPIEDASLFDMAPGPCVRLCVSDTGYGMDEETRERLFEPFFTTKPEGKGTGLGLSTVYGIVRQSGGAISVESELGAGTTFVVYLPRVSITDDKPDHDPSTTTRGGRETILIIEDEAAVRALTTRVLEGLGYRVLQAGGGEEAVREYGRWGERIDLVLADVVMPGMGGPECVCALAERRDDFRTLYMSGYTDDALGEYGVLDDGTQLLRKPFDIDTLPGIIRRAIEQPAPGGAAVPAPVPKG